MAPIRALVGVVRALGGDPPAIVHVPIPAGEGDATGWARRLREVTLDIIRDPEPAPSR